MTIEEVFDLLVDLNIENEDDEWTINKKIVKAGYDIHKFSIYSGASKFCLVFKDTDFVLKWAREDEFHTYNEAVKEAEIYENAKCVGLECFFPKTKIFGEFNGIIFVAQEKIDFSVIHVPKTKDAKYDRIVRTTTNHIKDKMQKQFDEACSNNKHARVLNKRWAGMVLSLYGKRKAKQLCQFIIKHQINDLHSDNLGYKNDRPIIFDFSGYSRD